MKIKSLVQNHSTDVCSTNLEVMSFYYDLVYESLCSMAKAYKHVYIYIYDQLYCVILTTCTLQPYFCVYMFLLGSSMNMPSLHIIYCSLSA